MATGCKFLSLTDSIDNNQLSSDTDSDEDTEQSLIEYYFSRGFHYKSIVDFFIKIFCENNFDTNDSDMNFILLQEASKRRCNQIKFISLSFVSKLLLISSKKRHGIVISERTLRNRSNEYGLRRRSPSSDINDVRRAMHELLNGPGNMGG